MGFGRDRFDGHRIDRSVAVENERERPVVPVKRTAARKAAWRHFEIDR